MPYGLVPVAVAIVLGPIYLLSDAGPASKAAVAALLALAFVISWTVPAWWLAATLLQCGVCIYILFRLDLRL